MATRWAVATGNWSDTATWDGGTLPASGDTVYADGKTVTIDQDITVVSINTTQRTGGTNGGTFSVNTTRNLTCNINTGSGNGLTCTHGAGTTLTVTGNVIGSITSSNIHGISSTGSGDIVINGNVTAGSTPSCGVYCTNSSASITVNGNVAASSATGVYCLNGITSLTVTGTITGSGTMYGLYIGGNVTTLNIDSSKCSNTYAVYVGGTGTLSFTSSGTSCTGIVMPNLTNGTFTSTVGMQNCTVSGAIANISGGDIISCTFYSTDINLSTPSNAGAMRGIVINGVGNDVTITNDITCVGTIRGLDNTSTRNISITGNVTASPTNGNSHGIYNTSSGNIEITGNVYAGANPSYGINATGSGNITVNGNLYVNLNSHCIYSTNLNSIITINGDIIAASTNYSAIYCTSVTTANNITVTGNITGSATGFAIYMVGTPSVLNVDYTKCSISYAIYAGGAGSYSLSFTGIRPQGISMPNLTSGSFSADIGAINCAFGGTSATVSGGDIIGCTFNSTDISLNASGYNFYGNIIGGTGNAIIIPHDIRAVNANGLTINSNRDVTINGSVYGNVSTTVAGTGISNNGAGTISISGNVTSGIGNVANTSGVHNTASGTIIISGMVKSLGTSTGGAQYSCGVWNTGSGVIYAYGNVYASTTASYFCSGIYNNTGIVNVGTALNPVEIYGGSGSQMAGIYQVGSGVVTVYANLIGGAVNQAINNVGNGIVNIIAPTSGILSNTGTVTAVYNTAGGTINITGTLSGHTSANAFVANAGAGTVNHTGDVYANDKLTSTGVIYNSGVGTINISGNIIGGTSSTAYATVNASTGSIYITGNITGGSGATAAPALYSTTNGIFDVTGNAIANGAPAIISNGIAATNIIRGNMIGSTTMSPFMCFKISCLSASTQNISIPDTVGDLRYFTTNNIVSGMPSTYDVKYGTVYGISDEYVGTCHIPSSLSVNYGVSVDNTVGEAYLTPQLLWECALSAITSGIGSRLKNCSTVDSVGNQIGAL